MVRIWGMREKTKPEAEQGPGISEILQISGNPACYILEKWTVCYLSR